jgi:hypothetical protein
MEEGAGEMRADQQQKQNRAGQMQVGQDRSQCLVLAQRR